MKAIIIILLFGISFSYNPGAAITYARKYCNYPNPGNYDYYRSGENAHFVSECLAAGGQRFDGCSGLNSKGMFHSVGYLKNCLLSKGWKLSKSRSTNYKAGYPIFLKGGNHAMLITGFDGDDIIFCSHEKDRCDAKIKAYSVDYYYKY